VRQRTIAWLVAGGVVYVVTAVLAQWPTTAGTYRDGVHQAAEEGVSQLGTVIIAEREDGEGRLMAPYFAVVTGDARSALASALESVTSAEIPDAESARLRDRASDLLRRAAAAVGDLEHGEADPGKLRHLRDALDDLADETA
jgi:hypothetical protein